MTKNIQKKSFLCTLLLMQSILMLQVQSQNTVGAIPGVIDVSPMGAATYTIPIDVVPGTQGVQPNLSIVYNSFGGMGILGMKWNLSGLSAITRCGQIPYYDNGDMKAIRFTTEDRLALDGNRLLKLSSNGYWATGEEYATEMEDFTRIVSYGGTTGNPDYFKAYTDDGSIIEYGTKQTLATDKTLSWLINRITDANGNYMTFSYTQYWGNEILIDEINYTGNASAGINPYAKVKFSYTTNSLNSNICFVGGFAINQSLLLSKITISYKDTLVRKYQFGYNKGMSGERTAHLKEIVLFGEGKNPPQLNATTIEWGTQNNSIEAPQINGLLQGSTSGSIHTGDFDGDGYTDVILFGAGANRNTWMLYLYKPVSKTFVFDQQGTHQNPYISNQSAADSYGFSYNMGNGKYGFLIAERVMGDNYWSFRQISFNPYFEQSRGTLYGFKDVFFGNFSGHGTEILFLHTYNDKNYVLTTSDQNVVIQFSTNKGAPYKVLVADIEGSGRDNIQVVVDCKADTYGYDNYNGVNLILIDGFPTIYHHVYYGDFNGDGILDALVYTVDKSWLLHVGKGKCEFTHPKPLEVISQLNATPMHNGSRPPPKYPVIIADVNGDGKDEIIQALNWIDGTTGKTRLDFYSLYDFSDEGRCSVSKFNQVTLDEWCTDIIHFNLGDFNYDGKVDILMRSSIYDKPRVVSVNKNEQYEFIKQIADGMGKQIKLTYQPGYYVAESISYIPSPFILKKKYFLPLVKSLQVLDEKENFFNNMSFSFSNPAFSYRRNIFLGFRVFEQSDIQKNGKNTFYQKIDDSNHNQSGVDFGNREILVPTKHDYSLLNNGKIYNQTVYSSKLKTISCYPNPYRYVSYFDTVTIKNFVSDIKTVTTNKLNSEGRIGTSNTKTFDGCIDVDLIHYEANTYTYQTIVLNGYQKKTVPTQILTTQKYIGISNIEIADTLSYGYNSAGRLTWMRKVNSDGIISTQYEDYTVAGVYRKKAVTAGNDSRQETYIYDATRRFITQITNFYGHTNKFTYDGKRGNKITETDANGLVTTYKYDEFGNIKQIFYPDKTQDYFIVNRQLGANPPNAKYYTISISSGKPDVYIYYDILGREVCRLEDGFYYQTVYNNKGQMVETTGPFSNFNTPPDIKHTYTYDEYGRKKTEKAPYTDLEYEYDTNDKRKVTVTDKLRSVSSSKNYDALGRIINAQDFGGNINYSYTITNNKKHQTTISAVGATTTIISDLWGNRLSITDPDAGLIKSTYNGFGELIKQIDARGDTTTYQYDKLGRIKQKRFAAPREKPQTISYTYDNTAIAGKGIGKLYQIQIDGVQTEIFCYDEYSRLKKHTKKIDKVFYDTKYKYDLNGQLETLTYPDGFSVKYKYSPTGKLEEILNNSDNTLIYKVASRNKFNAPTHCEYGNGVATDYTYNSNGLLTWIKTGDKKKFIILKPGEGENPKDVGIIIPNPIYVVDSNVLNYRYAYDKRGLITSRSESVINCKESYIYDPLDRLTYINNQEQQYGISYNNNGNIEMKGREIYTYGSPKPHAVTSVANNPISCSNSTVTYNFFNQPTHIEENNQQIALYYGANQQRNKTVILTKGETKYTQYHISKYFEAEKKPDSDTTRFYSYIYGDIGVVALNISTFSKQANDSIITHKPELDREKATTVTYDMFYIHTDHLGSYCALTDTGKNVVQRNYFDPWGNFKWIFRSRDGGFSQGNDSLSAQEFTAINFSLTRRGFTGHEHYPQFNIINMNGRLYDPVIGRFFSPDKYVANSSFTQDYNRYTYARNCPLMYTDPDGEFVQYILGAFMGGISGWQMGQAAGAKGWKMAGFILGGAAIGAGTAGLGSYVSTTIAATTSFGVIGSGLAGAAIGGAVAGAANGLGFGILNASMTGQWNAGAIFKGAGIGAFTGFVGGGLGSYVGGTGGALLGGAASGALGSALNGGNWKDVLLSAAIGAGTSAAAYEISMGIEYAKYNKSSRAFGDLKYGGFRKMSVAVQRSFARNREAVGWILNDGTVGDIVFGTKDRAPVPNRPDNARSLFHTHTLVTAGIEWHSPADMAKKREHVIGWSNIYSYDAVANPYHPIPYNENYIIYNLIPSLLNTSSQVFNISPFYLYKY